MKWRVEIEQNGGEYLGWALISAESVKIVSDRTVIADGVEIEFDENITALDVVR